MGYQTVKEGISKMLVSQGFYESGDVFNFTEESDQSIMKKFRIERPSVDLTAEGVEFLSNLVRPLFEYEISLGFKLSAEKQVLDYDISQNIVDVIISYFNNPVNYTSYAIKMKTRAITTARVDEHLEARIQLEVIDDITLT